MATLRDCLTLPVSPAELLDHWNRRSIASVSKHFLTDLSEEQLDKIAEGIKSAFQEFKVARTDPDGSVFVAKLGGPLDSNASQRTFEGTEYYGTMAKRPVGEVHPWECAGPFVSGPLDLVMHLWRVGSEQLSAQIDSHGLDTVLAVALGSYYQSAEWRSLVTTNELLTSMISASANHWKSAAIEAARHIDGTEAQRRKAAVALQRQGVEAMKANSAGERARRLAAYYKVEHPIAKKPEVVAYVKDRLAQNDYSLKRTTKTIGRLIAGYEEDAIMITKQRGP